MPTCDESPPSYLQNVDYDDVLHLYRGWRRSERALEEKSREFALLQAKSDQLQESHIRFRAQIKSLETIKEFAMKLQSQLRIAQQENTYLVKENKELVHSNSKAETQSVELTNAVVSKTQACRDAMSQADKLRGLNKESIAEQELLAAKLTSEEALRVAAETRLTSNNDLVSTLRTENNNLRKNLDSNLIHATQCDQQLDIASQQISFLSEEAAKANSIKELLHTAELEVGVLKGDISRLLRLMDHYPASKEFLQRWHISDGMSFIGMGVLPSNISPEEMDATPLLSSPKNHRIPFVEDFGEFDEFQDSPSDEAEIGANDITPGEFYQLKIAHGGGDPFPMMTTFEAESELWVPRKAAHIGLRFLAQKIPHAPQKLITDFLRRINKVWLKREVRKFLDVKTFYDGQIAGLKRQIANLRPYDDVIANNDIRRLRAQVRVEHCKVLKGRAKRVTDMGYYDMFEEADDVQDDIHIHTSGERIGRLCDQVPRRKGGGSVITVSKEKLLEASLLSLQTLGRQHQAFDGSASLDTGMGPRADNMETGMHPNGSFLRGALWLGKNVVMVIEELAESLDYFRSRFMAEVSAAAGDSNLKRSRHRLNLLAATSINETLSVVNKGRVRAREILQSAACLNSGDLSTFLEFERTLPIESSLPSPSPVKRAGSRDRRGGSSC